MKNLEQLKNDASTYLETTTDFIKDEFEENPEIFKMIAGVLAGVAIGAIAVLLLSPKSAVEKRKKVGNSPKGF